MTHGTSAPRDGHLITAEAGTGNSGKHLNRGGESPYSQLRITFPELPERMASKPFSNSW